MISCSILIPVYNGIHTLKAAIASADAQGWAASEIVVVDNHSSDGTWEMLEQESTSRLRRHRNDRNVGLFGNFNRCLELASCEIVLFLCADDRLSPRMLEACLPLFEQHADLALLNARGDAVDSSGRVLKRLGAIVKPGIYDGLKAQKALLSFHSESGINPFNYPGGVLMRRSMLQGLRFDEGMRRVGDIDFFYRLLEKGRFAQTETALCLISFHDAQEGKQRRDEPIELVEFETIVRKLPLEPLLARMLLRNFRALALWRATLLLIKGSRGGFSQHASHAYAGEGRLGVSLAYLAFVLRRIRMKFRQPRIEIDP